MRFPAHIMTDTIQNSVRNAIRGSKRYPFVLMLEPLYTCNLACIGCAIERHTGKLKDRLPLENCLEAVERVRGPGRLDLRRRADDLPRAAASWSRRSSSASGTSTSAPTACCSTRRSSATIAPHKRLTINVHLDGMRETHDKVCAREGVFDKAIAMIREGVEARLPRHDQHDGLQGDQRRRGRGALQDAHGHGRRRDAGLARLPLRVGRRRHLPDASPRSTRSSSACSRSPRSTS